MSDDAPSERVKALEDALRNTLHMLAECDCIYSDSDEHRCPCKVARDLLAAESSAQVQPSRDEHGRSGLANG